MFEITIPPSEYYDDKINEFIKFEGGIVRLEHSLSSVSNWESIWEKPFLTEDEKSYDEIVSYFYCAQTTTNLPVESFRNLTKDDVERFFTYINKKRSATWFSTTPEPSRQVVTSELIYYWIFSYGIDISVEKWHLNRLFTLLRVFGEKNNPEKNKMTREQLANRNRELNRKRKEAMKNNG